jgi:hypothetical protein
VNDWVPASRRTRIYVFFAAVSLSLAAVLGLLSKSVSDPLDMASYALMFVMLIVSWVITLWSALHCRNRRLRLGWLLVATGQAASFGASLFMVVVAVSHPDRPYNPASPILTLAFSLVGVGLVVGATSVQGPGLRRRPFIQAAALSVFMFVVMLAALLAPGPTMPFSIGARDVSAIWRLAVDCGFIFMAGTYATLLQLRLPDGHRARSWMWAAASALIAAMGDVAAPLVDVGHGQIYPGLLWCLGDILLAAAATLAADFELAEAPDASPSELPVRAEAPIAEPATSPAELAET